jgi:hypothetical protein
MATTVSESPAFRIACVGHSVQMAPSGDRISEGGEAGCSATATAREPDPSLCRTFATCGAGCAGVKVSKTALGGRGPRGGPPWSVALARLLRRCRRRGSSVAWECARP